MIGDNGYKPSGIGQNTSPTRAAIGCVLAFGLFCGHAVNCGYAVALAEYALGGVGAQPSENSLTARKDGLGAAMWSGKHAPQTAPEGTRGKIA